MKQMKSHSIDTDVTDLETWLLSLASQLRNHGLALVGRASRESGPGEKEHRDLYEVLYSLERVAAMLEAATHRLCQECKLMDVAAQVTFGGLSENSEDSRPKTRKLSKDR